MDRPFSSTFKYRLIYIFKCRNNIHSGLLKIGHTTITASSIEGLTENCKALNDAAHKRIKTYTNTVGISYELLHTELAVYHERDCAGNEIMKSFSDKNVHRVLENSNINKQKIKDCTSKEWFKIDLETAKKAIKAVKNGYFNLSHEKKTDYIPIVYRPEQEDAIDKTLKQFKKGNRMLWNAKMRFGKTMCALEVIKKSKFKKTIILTHRPVVDISWYEDFGKVFAADTQYIYGSKNKGNSIGNLIKIQEDDADKKFVYFASIQDLRGSCDVGGKYNKNNEIFALDWDFVIVDEAHEGTTTSLGNDVIKKIVKGDNEYDTKFLALSGTPFNILGDYEDNIYTWDYIMEQSCKKKWDELNFGDSNPYDDLPELNIFTYDLGKLLDNKNYVALGDKAFNFREFFRVWTGDLKNDKKPLPPNKKIGDFYHENDVLSFLNLMTKEDNYSHYPYANEEYRNLFKHTLWIVPGVKEARALSVLMKKHSVFGCGVFNVINVAGDGDEEEKTDDALRKVREAIDNSGDNFTITLSCGKLTTGVTVPEWTAVFMLSGSSSTSAANYLQTIFRVQSPCSKNGRVKTSCYVFDFAPDRTLKMVAESVAISTKAGKTSLSDKQILGEFLNYCPVVSLDGTRMIKYDESRLLQKLKNAYAEKVVRNGFDDKNLYNDELLRLNEIDINKFNDLKEIIKSSNAIPKTRTIDINSQGFTDEEYRKVNEAEKKPFKTRTPEEQELIDRLKEQKKLRDTAISILRCISIRIPLLIYGADVDVDKDITVDDLVKLVDDASWSDFMPEGVTKQKFIEFKKYYDAEIFIAAGRKIRNIVVEADYLTPTERVKKIGSLFSCFKNPDKETVLTPWNVVNAHIGDCLGGYSFFDIDNVTTIDTPRFIEYKHITSETVINKNARILEINSKSGLYPLYIAYSIYRTRYVNEYDNAEDATDISILNKLWSEVVNENIFIISKTKMAKSITKRTLVGFKDIEVNSHYVENIISKLTHKPEQFMSKISKSSYWKKKGSEKMKFDAIVGNPPYQQNISSNSNNSALAKQLFPLFITNSIKLKPNYISFITPSRWFTGNAQDKSFIKLREFIKDNNHISKIFHYKNEKELFPNVAIKGGVNYFLYETGYSGNVDFFDCSGGEKNCQSRSLFEDGLDIILDDNKFSYPIICKVKDSEFVSLTTITKGRDAFGISGATSNVNNISKESPFLNAAELRCKGNIVRYIEQNKVVKNRDLFERYKVFISKSAGNPNSDSKVIGHPYIGYPYSACTDSLIPIGNFETLEEAENLSKYLQTKFLRFLVSILKSSQNVCQIVYKFVPMQDFSNNSDLNWHSTIDEIDEQLYLKYGLSTEEISHINETIK
ncbi:Eco57I restriction-modification methylase domain-containing protein [Clostridium perfringens]